MALSLDVPPMLLARADRITLADFRLWHISSVRHIRR
jgi:hypothetical protein